MKYFFKANVVILCQTLARASLLYYNGKHYCEILHQPLTPSGVVEALCYKPKGRGFDLRCHRIFFSI
jgi:hypothetical protein